MQSHRISHAQPWCSGGVEAQPSYRPQSPRSFFGEVTAGDRNNGLNWQLGAGLVRRPAT